MASRTAGLPASPTGGVKPGAQDRGPGLCMARWPPRGTVHCGPVPRAPGGPDLPTDGPQGSWCSQGGATQGRLVPPPDSGCRALGFIGKGTPGWGACGSASPGVRLLSPVRHWEETGALVSKRSSHQLRAAGRGRLPLSRTPVAILGGNPPNRGAGQSRLYFGVGPELLTGGLWIASDTPLILWKGQS